MSQVYYVLGFHHDDHTTYARAIHYQNLKYSVIPTKYTFFSAAVIEKNHTNQFYEAMQSFTESNLCTVNIHIIYNFQMRGSNMDLYNLLAMHQAYNVNDIWEGVLILFETHSIMACRTVMSYMKAYVRGKPSHGATQDAFNLHMSLQLQMFIQQYTTEMPWIKTKIDSVPNTVSRVCTYSNINFESIFAPCGYFKLEADGEKISYIASMQESFIDKLPIFIIDIETIANDMGTVPLGTHRSERISSLVLKVTYFNVKMYFILYLSLDYKDEAQKFNKEFTQRYSNNDNDIYIYIQNFQDDKELMECFIDLYSSGKILMYLTGDTNYPHILTGHNILEYDFEVMATVMKRHRMHSLFEKYVTINHPTRRPVVIRFHSSAIILDLFQIAKRNVLSSVGYSLKAMSKAVSSEDNQQKYDLNSINIRHWYILNQYIETTTDRQLLRKYFDLEPNLEAQMKIVESTMEYNFNDLQYKNIRVPAGTFSRNEIKIRVLDSLEKILVYNMTDCSAVGYILKTNNYYNLCIEFAKMFNMDLESSTYFGNSSRLKSCIELQQLNFNHFYGVTDRTKHITCLPSLKSFFTDDLNDLNKYKVEKARDWGNTGNKKAYAGALNFAKPGFARKVFGIDFVSYYPNLLCARKMSLHRIAMVTVQNLLNLPRQKDLADFVNAAVLTLYCAEDLMPEKSLALSYRGREIAHRLTMQDLYVYRAQTDGQGKVIIYCEETYPDAFYKIAQSLLKRRAEAKANLKRTKDALSCKQKERVNLENNEPASSALATIDKEIESLHKTKNVHDASQLCLKIVVNSLYGVCGANTFVYSHVPMAALITLLGRAKLSLCSRLAVYFYYKEILTNDKYANLCVSENGIIAVKNLSGNLVTLDYLEEAYQYLCDIAPFSLQRKTTKSFFSNDDCVVPDTDDVFPDSDIIIYTDTDGILFTNFRNIDCHPVLAKINNFIVQYFPSDCLVLEADKNYDVIGILGKKAYFMANANKSIGGIQLLTPQHEPHSSKYLYSTIQDYFKNIKCKHNGYERNAPAYIKRIYNYVVSLAFVSNKFNVQINHLEVIFAIFNYMKYLNQYELSVNVPLNEHRDRSTLATYIERNTTSFKGSVQTMFILSSKVYSRSKHTDIEIDIYNTLTEWEVNQNPIHYVKTMKTHVKTLWRIIDMCKTTPVIRSFIKSNHDNIIQKMQSFANAFYSMWGNWLPNDRAESIDNLYKLFRPDTFKYEKTLQCRNNITVDNITTKNRQNETVQVSYDIANFELPNFICQQIARKI